MDMKSVLSLHRLASFFLASTCAAAVMAAPQSLTTEDVLLNSDTVVMVAETSYWFRWTPDEGFAAIPQAPENEPEPNGPVVVDLLSQVLPGVCGATSVLRGVNIRGEIVGDSGGETPVATFWGVDGEPVALADRLASPLPTGFQLLGAADISDAGEIAATALSVTGSVYLIKLTPNRDAPGTYSPRLLGEIFTAIPNLPDVRLVVSEAGDIVGQCGFGAVDCPTGQFEFAGLDPSITNLGGPVPFLPLRAGSSFAGRSSSLFGNGNGGEGIGRAGSSENTPGLINRSRPTFGGPTLPTLRSSGGTASVTGGTIPAAVPLPAAGFLMLLGLFLLRGPARILTALREAVVGRLDRTA